jgi:iron complex transport system ATP-binding protein
MSHAPAVIELTSVTLVRDDHIILDNIRWAVQPRQRWVVLGANGSGKTSLVQIAALKLHPSSGRVRVLGEELGRTDVRMLRRRIAYVSAALAGELRRELTAVDIVMTAKNAALEPWWHRYDDTDRTRAQDCLERMGVATFTNRPFWTMSSGEQQRVLLARSLMNDPLVVLLDEPSARLDLGGREQLVGALNELAADASGPATVLVTHHVDEIPPAMTHALLLKAGKVVASGPIHRVLTSESLSDCFGIALHLDRRTDGRMSAWATGGRPAHDRRGDRPARPASERLVRTSSPSRPAPPASIRSTRRGI